MELGLKDKVAIVAAASKGLGKAVALGLAFEGAKVSICARHADDLQRAAEDIRKSKSMSVMCMALLWMGFSPLFAQGGKISGYMFGDYYYVAANHNRDLENQNGFWFRRIYFTYDKGLSEAFAIRFRLEFNSPGDFSTKAKLEPYIKDAYLQWKAPRHSILFGVSPAPTWEVIETVWGYRSVGKTPLDLQKFGDSRDFGMPSRAHWTRASG